MCSFSLHKLPDSIGPKAATIVSKKALRLAHERNRAKRRLRAAIYKHLGEFKTGYGYVFTIKKELHDADADEISKEVEQLLSTQRLP